MKCLARKCAHHSDMINAERGDIYASSTLTARKDKRDAGWSAQVILGLLGIARRSRTECLSE